MKNDISEVISIFAATYWFYGLFHLKKEAMFAIFRCRKHLYCSFWFSTLGEPGSDDTFDRFTLTTKYLLLQHLDFMNFMAKSGRLYTWPDFAKNQIPPAEQRQLSSLCFLDKTFLDKTNLVLLSLIYTKKINSLNLKCV